MTRRTTTLLAAVAIALGGAGFAHGGGLAPPPVAAAVQKSLDSGASGGGNAAGAGQRFGELLSGWGIPVITAIAGCLLIGALATRNIGASVGIVVISLLALIFLVAPASVETFAKSVAGVIF